MATCSRPIYPPAVIKSVAEQMEQASGDQDLAIVSERLLQLKPCMKQANLRDAVVSRTVLLVASGSTGGACSICAAKHLFLTFFLFFPFSVDRCFAARSW